MFIHPLGNETKVLPENEYGSILIPKISLSGDGGNTQAPGISNLRVHKKAFYRKKWVQILGIFLILIVILGCFIFYQTQKLLTKAKELSLEADKIQAVIKEQDLDKIKTELQNTKTLMTDFQNEYNNLHWAKALPYLGSFVSDGEHAINAGRIGLDAADVLLQTIEPYADIIGFKGGSKANTSSVETTQDRLDFVIKSLPDLVAKSDIMADKMSQIKSEVDKIDPSRYPNTLFGKEVKSKIQKVRDMTDLAADLIVKGKPVLEEAPYLLGVDSARKYLVLFQNDKELRPTGGFITAYTIAQVDKGRFKPVLSSDIYSLDNSYKPSIKAPDPLIKYLKGPYTLSPKYRLRDMNWNPDFAISMDLFTKEAKSVGINNIDGVIAVDTQVLVNILNVIGPIGVSGFGNFSTDIVPECNCPQVIHELESFADVEGPVVWSENEPGKIVYAPANYDNRKKIIGPLMNSILANALGQPKDKLPALFNAGLKSLLEKHVIFYLNDEKAENSVKEFGIGGNLVSYDGDYLHINDANLGGRKSNLYVTQAVEQTVAVSQDGSVEKTLTITYRNSAAYDGWLNSILPDWIRVYVPKGSELISFEGVSEQQKPYVEADKTVFAGYYELRPQGIAKIVIKYRLPFKVKGEYNLYIQKQAGTDVPSYQITVGRKQDEFVLNMDKEYKVKL